MSFYLFEGEKTRMSVGRGRGTTRFPTEQGAWCGAECNLWPLTVNGRFPSGDIF